MRLIFSLMTLVFMACGTESGSNEEDSEPRFEDTTEYASQEPKQPGRADVNTFRTETGKQFIVIEKTGSASLSRITVQGMGFQMEKIFTFSDTDPLEEGLVGDLDGDGFDELYVVTRSAGTGSYATVMGFASVEDKTYEEITIPDIDTSTPSFKGYRGKDRVGVRGDELWREFPVYNEDDVNARPTGGSRIVMYRLVRNDVGYALEVSGSR